MLAAPATAETIGDCTKTNDPTTQVTVTQDQGRATLVVASSPSRRNQVVRVDYGGETYVGRFDDNGRAALNFALVGMENSLNVLGGEFDAVRCQVAFPDMAKFYRVILRWQDQVRLDLHVVEPGGRMGEYGHIYPGSPNTQRNRGIGRIDVVTDAIEDGATGEQSYVVDEAARPVGVFTFRWEYVTRRARRESQFCGSGALANIEFTLIILEHGRKLPVKRYATGSMPCGSPPPEPRRID